jgi:hypothetical protein
VVLVSVSGGARIFRQGGLSPPLNFTVLRAMENENMPLPPALIYLPPKILTKIAVQYRQMYKMF